MRVIAAVAVLHQVWCGRCQHAPGWRHVTAFDGERDATVAAAPIDKPAAMLAAAASVNPVIAGS
jgi:hypothetical protein